MAYFTDLGYLEKIRWVDGTAVFCKRCDRMTPMKARVTKTGVQLICGSGHRTHPANVVLRG